MDKKHNSLSEEELYNVIVKYLDGKSYPIRGKRISKYFKKEYDIEISASELYPKLKKLEEMCKIKLEKRGKITYYSKS